jgi:DNA end-binding protein Ku
MSRIASVPAPFADTCPHAGPPGGGRPSWSGLLQLSLVGIPLKAYPAVRSREASHFHQFHADCGQRIRYAKQCPVHGGVDGAAIVRGYEYGPGRHVLLEPEELDPLRPAQDRALRLERFLEPAQLDPLLLSGRGLHLLADGPAAAFAYGVLVAAMTERGRWAVGRMVLGGQRQVVLVRPAGTLLVLHVLHYPEAVRGGAALPGPQLPGADSEELRLAGQLIDAASGRVDWSAYRDETAQELRALVDAKVQGLRPEDEPVPVVLPLLQALQQSVAGTVAGAAGAASGPAAAPRKRGRRTA